MLARPYYTAEQLFENANRLPGFITTANLYDVLEYQAEDVLWQTVLSATVLANFDGQLHVLTGNRTATGNSTHSNVASTPTMRVPIQSAGILLADDVPFCLDGDINPSSPFVSDSLEPSLAWLPDNTDALAAQAGRLLSLKLGLAKHMEAARSPIGRTSLARCVVGFSYLEDDKSGQPIFEPLVMLGIVIGLETDIAKAIPRQTGSYDHLGWVPITSYRHGVATKDVSEVLPGINPEEALEVCVRGLCNTTTAAIVRDENEIIRHLTENGLARNF